MGATLFHMGLSPAVTPSMPLNGACHSAALLWDLTGQERARERRGKREQRRKKEDGGRAKER